MSKVFWRRQQENLRRGALMLAMLVLLQFPNQCNPVAEYDATRTALAVGQSVAATDTPPTPTPLPTATPEPPTPTPLPTATPEPPKLCDLLLSKYLAPGGETPLQAVDENGNPLSGGRYETDSGTVTEHQGAAYLQGDPEAQPGDTANVSYSDDEGRNCSAELSYLEYVSAFVEDALQDVQDYEMTALAEQYEPYDDIWYALSLWGGYPLSGLSAEQPPVLIMDGVEYPLLPVNEVSAWQQWGDWRSQYTGDWLPETEASGGAWPEDDDWGEVSSDDAVAYWVPSDAGEPVYRPLPPVLPNTTSRLPGGSPGLMSLVPAEGGVEGGWEGVQVYWRGEWDAGPLYFATPNALIRLEGAWSAVLYNAQSGETALWLEAGQATLLGSGGQPAVEVQGPGDGETVALVMVSPDGEVGEPQPVGPDVLAERFGAANALSNYFTVVAVVSGPYPPEARSDPQTFWKDHPWAVLLDTDGDSETGFPAMFPHERGLGQDAVFVLFDQLLYIMYTADGQSQPYAGQPPQVYQISDSALAFSFSISSLEEVLGDRLQPENLAWRLVHVNYTIPEPNSPKDALPDPPQE